jgi:hypothetical protein
MLKEPQMLNNGRLEEVQFRVDGRHARDDASCWVSGFLVLEPESIQFLKNKNGKIRLRMQSYYRDNSEDDALSRFDHVVDYKSQGRPGESEGRVYFELLCVIPNATMRSSESIFEHAVELFFRVYANIANSAGEPLAFVPGESEGNPAAADTNMRSVSYS